MICWTFLFRTTTEAHHYVVNACVHLSVVVVCLCFALEFMLLSADLQILIFSPLHNGNGQKVELWRRGVALVSNAV